MNEASDPSFSLGLFYLIDYRAMEGWIKIHRKLIDWEWYTDSKMVHLLFHLITKANHKDAKWRGVSIRRGQLITGLDKLKTQTGISTQSLRTCLDRLISTGEVTSKSTNKYRVITIVNYDSYQLNDSANKQATSKLTSNQQSTNNQLTANKKEKKKKNEKNEKNEKNNKEYTPKVFGGDIHSVYDSIVSMFPESTQPKTQNQIDNWKNEIRKLIEIDKIDEYSIIHIVKTVREDSFWSKNFLTIMKLRQKDKDGITYVVKFTEQFKQRKDEGITEAEYRDFIG